MKAMNAPTGISVKKPSERYSLTSEHSLVSKLVLTTLSNSRSKHEHKKTFIDYINEARSRITEVDIDIAELLISKGYKVLDIREPHEHNSKKIK